MGGIHIIHLHEINNAILREPLCDKMSVIKKVTPCMSREGKTFPRWHKDCSHFKLSKTFLSKSLGLKTVSTLSKVALSPGSH